MVALGLGVLVAALVAAAEPYRQTREFREVVECERSIGDCFGSEPGSMLAFRAFAWMFMSFMPVSITMPGDRREAVHHAATCAFRPIGRRGNSGPSSSCLPGYG